MTHPLQDGTELRERRNSLIWKVVMREPVPGGKVRQASGLHATTIAYLLEGKLGEVKPAYDFELERDFEPHDGSVVDETSA